MKKFLFWSFLAAAFLLPHAAYAQSICFWTDAIDVVPIRIYVDEEYIGDVTAAYDSQPELDAEGTLSLDLTPVHHKLTAVDKYGRVFKEWSGHLTPREGRIYYQRLHARGFREVNRADYGFVFLAWEPLFRLPGYYRYSRRVDDLYPLEDSGLLIGMATATIGGAAAMGVAASKNWNVIDNRFPYVALGFDTEYLSSMEEWRNVARLRARFGNKGGVSLMADAGIATFPGYYWDSAFTWSLGAGLDYGGFCLAVRYKPAVGRSSDTFLVARAEYDWWVSQRFALDFHLDFGVGGYGPDSLFDHYVFPIGLGFLIKL